MPPRKDTPELTREQRAARLAGAIAYFVPDVNGSPLLVASKGGIQELLGIDPTGSMGHLDIYSKDGELKFLNALRLHLARSVEEAVDALETSRAFVNTVRAYGACQFPLTEVDRIYSGHLDDPALWVRPLSAKLAEDLASWPMDWAYHRVLSDQELRDRNQGKTISFSRRDNVVPDGAKIGFADFGATEVHWAVGYVEQGGRRTHIGFPEEDPFVTVTSDGFSWLQIGADPMAREAFVIPVGINLGANPRDTRGVHAYLRSTLVPRLMEMNKDQMLWIDAQALTDRFLGARIEDSEIYGLLPSDLMQQSSAPTRALPTFGL